LHGLVFLTRSSSLFNITQYIFSQCHCESRKAWQSVVASEARQSQPFLTRSHSLFRAKRRNLLRSSRWHWNNCVCISSENSLNYLINIPKLIP
jgi:hypothetical protein